MPTLLIVEDEAVLGRNLGRAFTRPGFDVVHAERVEEAKRLLRETPPDVVLLDLRLPDGNGLDLLEVILTEEPDLPVIVMTANATVAEAVRAMKRGARDYVQKPLDLDELRLKVGQALAGARQRRELSYYRRREGTGTILGDAPATQQLRALVTRLARATGGPGAPAPTVLLLGETGSGKGHVARSLHAAGGRREGPFIEVNCTALPENLIEAELFGHERGAFTDAKSARPGLFETADGGTIFLDEIGHISPTLQTKFLKVIEDRAVRRLGATAVRKVDVQVIAATNRDLEAAMQLGEFRPDLYQRLNVAVVRVPPLRERVGDAVALAHHFLAGAVQRYALAPRTLSHQAEAAIARYPWPGNIRELGNAMERVALLSDADPVRPEDLQLPTVASGTGAVTVLPAGAVHIDLPDHGLSLEAVERACIEAAMSKAGGNQTAAARLLGVSRDTLRYRLEKFASGDLKP